LATTWSLRFSVRDFGCALFYINGGYMNKNIQSKEENIAEGKIDTKK